MNAEREKKEERDFERYGNLVREITHSYIEASDKIVAEMMSQSREGPGKSQDKYINI